MEVLLIINIRGTNGSGKSYVVRELMRRCISRDIYGILGARAAETHELDAKREMVNRLIYIIGPYNVSKINMSIGGCDRIQPYSNVTKLLNKYELRGHVIFEGSLISDNVGTMGEWLEARGRSAVVAYLTTPLGECLRRLQERTEDAGSKNVEKRYQAILRTRERFLEAGKVTVLDMASNTGAATILKLLKGGAR